VPGAKLRLLMRKHRELEFQRVIRAIEDDLVEEIAQALEGPGKLVGINAQTFATWVRSQAWRVKDGA